MAMSFCQGLQGFRCHCNMIDLTFTYLAVTQTAEFEWVSVTRAMSGCSSIKTLLIQGTTTNIAYCVVRAYHPTWSRQSFLCQLRKELQLKINSRVNSAYSTPAKHHPFCSWTRFQVIVSVVNCTPVELATFERRPQYQVMFQQLWFIQTPPSVSRFSDCWQNEVFS